MPTNRINAGAYVVEREVVESMIPAGRAVSFEREVFPQLVGHGLYGYDAAGYWVDIGQPLRYLEATWDLLAGRVASKLPARDQTGSLIYAGSLLAGAHVGPQSVVGRHCSVGTDSRIERAVLHDRVHVGADATRDRGGVGRARPGGGARTGAPAGHGGGRRRDRRRCRHRRGSKDRSRDRGGAGRPRGAARSRCHERTDSRPRDDRGRRPRGDARRRSGDAASARRRPVEGAVRGNQCRRQSRGGRCLRDGRIGDRWRSRRGRAR